MSRLPAVRRLAADIRSAKHGKAKVGQSADFLVARRTDLAQFDDLTHLAMSSAEEYALRGTSTKTIKSAKALGHHSQSYALRWPKSFGRAFGSVVGGVGPDYPGDRLGYVLGDASIRFGAVKLRSDVDELIGQARGESFGDELVGDSVLAVTPNAIVAAHGSGLRLGGPISS